VVVFFVEEIKERRTAFRRGTFSESTIISKRDTNLNTLGMQGSFLKTSKAGIFWRIPLAQYFYWQHFQQGKRIFKRLNSI
jgi:hypothetical protein